MASSKKSENKTIEKQVVLENQMPVEHLIFLERLPEELAERKEKVEQEVSTLEDRIKEAEENEKALKKNITKLKGQKTKLEKSIADLKNEIEKGTEDVAGLETEISDLQNKKRIIEQELAKNDQPISKPAEDRSHQNSKPKKTTIFLYILIGMIIGAAIMEAIRMHQSLQPLYVGNTITFGSYEQDGNPTNGREEIKWRVQSISDGRALLICDTCIEALPYNEQIGDNSWGNSSIRKWLNEEFYASAFSSEEKSVITKSEISTGRISGQENNSGKTYGETETTVDWVFIPDYSEIGTIDKTIDLSTVALNNFTANNVRYGQDEFQTMFWIRNPYGDNYNYTCGYNSEKKEREDYVFSSDTYALVRPAIYVDTKLYSKARKDEFDSEAILNNGRSSGSTTNGQDTDSSKSTAESQETNPSKLTAEDLDSISLSQDIHYYHLDLKSEKDPGFGPDCWHELSQSKSGDELSSAVRQEFFSRLKHDPVMAAACLAYVDRELGTYLTGKLYSEIEMNWVENINGIADEFISHTDIWNYNVTALETMLTNSASMNIEEAPGEHIRTFLMEQGNEHPVLGMCIYQLSENAGHHYLIFDISIKGSVQKLTFLIDSGFVPVLGLYEEE